MLDFAWGGHLRTQASCPWNFHARVSILTRLLKTDLDMRASH